MHRSVLDAVEMAEKGYSAAEIKKILEETREKNDYLHWPQHSGIPQKRWKSQLHDSPGSRCPEHQTSHALQHRNPRYLPEMPRYEEVPQVMIDAMKHELETNFREEYAAGKVYLMAASSSTDEATEEWVNQIKESFPGMEVMCDKLSFGLSCHIGPDGLGIGCTCKPV